MQPINNSKNIAGLYSSDDLGKAIHAVIRGEDTVLLKAIFVRKHCETALFSNENSDLDKSHPLVIVGVDAKPIQATAEEPGTAVGLVDSSFP